MSGMHWILDIIVVGVIVAIPTLYAYIVGRRLYRAITLRFQAESPAVREVHKQSNSKRMEG